MKSLFCFSGGTCMGAGGLGCRRLVDDSMQRMKEMRLHTSLLGNSREQFSYDLVAFL